MKTGTVWIHVGEYDVSPWADALAAIRPDLEILTGTIPEDLRDVEIAIVWAPPAGLLAKMPKLKAILALSAGAEAILSDPDLPDVPLARFVHSSTQSYYRDYVVHSLLHHHRHMEEFRQAQADRVWTYIPTKPYESVHVGVLGLGALGQVTAQAIRALGFPVMGWSRSNKVIDGIETLQGKEGLEALVKRSNVLVGMLPSTPETAALINAELLAALPEGAYIINAGRGDHVVEPDLLAAINSGHISGATLDVLCEEPPAPNHKFWSHPKIRLTPHIASTPDPSASVETLSGNIDRVLNGALPEPLVDRNRGY